MSKFTNKEIEIMMEEAINALDWALYANLQKEADKRGI